MFKMSQRNQSPVHIHSLDADICLRVPVHFCYSFLIGVMQCDGGLAVPDGRGRLSIISTLPSVWTLGVLRGAKIVPCTTTIPSFWAAPPLSFVSMTLQSRDGPAALQSAAPPSPS